MLKGLFGRKKRPGKSVNDVRKRPKSKSKTVPKTGEDALEDRIKARRAKTLRMADIRAEMAKVGHFERPDIAGAIGAARAAVADSGTADRSDTIDRALRLKGSAQVIDETLAHPSWRYVALAIVRGLLEEGGEQSPKTKAGRNEPKKPRDKG